MIRLVWKNKVGMYLVIKKKDNWGVITYTAKFTADINRATTDYGILPFPVRKLKLTLKPVKVEVITTVKEIA